RSRTLVLPIHYLARARLAAVAGARGELCLEGERPPQTVAQGWTEIALAVKRHRRRLFDPVSCRVAYLPDEQPRYGKRIRSGSFNSAWNSSLDHASRYSW